MVLSDQSNAPAPEMLTQQHTPRREPPMWEVAERIATSLGVTDEQGRGRIRHIVWEFGRTQAQRLRGEALEGEAVEGQTRADRFFLLVETKGIKKQRPWVAQQPSSSEQASRVGEVAGLLAEQLGEQEPGPRQMLYRSVQILGGEAALALLQQTHEREAAGGTLIPDGSRRRTPGGVYFLLVRQQASAEQQRRIFSLGGFKQRKKQTAPGTTAPQSSPKQEHPRPQPVAPLTWAERGQILDEAQQDRGVATVKMTVIGRPSKIVERGTCVALVMQQAAKIPGITGRTAAAPGGSSGSDDL